MDGLYSIPNWDRDYENHETRKLKRLAFLPIRIDQFEDVYRTAGPAVAGTWTALIALAARSPVRGELRDFATKPLRKRDVSATLLRRNSTIFAHVDLLVSMGWLTFSPAEGIEGKTESARARDTVVVVRGEDPKPVPASVVPATVQDSRVPADFDGQVCFEELAARYPRNRTRRGLVVQAAYAEQVRIDPWGRHAQIMAAVAAWEKSEEWTKEGGRYIPGLESFLRNEVWRSPPIPPAAPQRAEPEHEAWYREAAAAAARAGVV